MTAKGVKSGQRTTTNRAGTNHVIVRCRQYSLNRGFAREERPKQSYQSPLIPPEVLIGTGASPKGTALRILSSFFKRRCPTQSCGGFELSRQFNRKNQSPFDSLPMFQSGQALRQGGLNSCVLLFFIKEVSRCFNRAGGFRLLLPTRFTLRDRNDSEGCEVRATDNKQLCRGESCHCPLPEILNKQGLCEGGMNEAILPIPLNPSRCFNRDGGFTKGDGAPNLVLLF